MKILVRDNVVLFYGEVKKGIFPEADPTRELYKINESMYSITDDIIEYNIENIPEDFIQGKYCYTEEEGFYLNTEYTETEEKTLAEQLKEAKAEIDSLRAELQQVQVQLSNI
jgi:hypothetical protein